MDRSTSEDEMDADFEPDAGPSRLGAFLGGALLGLALCATAAIAVSLLMPLPRDPQQAVPVEATGSAPVAADAEQAGDEPAAAVPDDPATDETATVEATDRAPDAVSGPALDNEAPADGIPTDEPAKTPAGTAAATGDASESVSPFRERVEPGSSGADLHGLPGTGPAAPDSRGPMDGPAGEPSSQPPEMSEPPLSEPGDEAARPAGE
ncbi:MAG TPA: hypothetical protein VFJ13_05465 [Paracoccaceae bacterium]|nr:hypothetical protein [Paracoccaceae bacterium]